LGIYGRCERKDFAEKINLEGALVQYVKFLDLCKEFPEEELIPTLVMCWRRKGKR